MQTADVLMATDETLGERIQRLRLAKKLTQAKLAAKAGLNLGAVRNYEQDQREPKANVIAKLALALGVSSDVILGIHIEDAEDKPDDDLPASD